MASVFAVVELHALDDNVFVKLQTFANHDLFNGNLEGITVDLWFFNFREQVHEEVIEESDILEHKLR